MTCDISQTQSLFICAKAANKANSSCMYADTELLAQRPDSYLWGARVYKSIDSCKFPSYLHHLHWMGDETKLQYFVQEKKRKKNPNNNMWGKFKRGGEREGRSSFRLTPTESWLPSGMRFPFCHRWLRFPSRAWPWRSPVIGRWSSECTEKTLWCLLSLRFASNLWVSFKLFIH